MSSANDLRVTTPSRYCGGTALADANRRQLCEKTAELFVTRSDTLLVRGIGVGLGKRLSWPEARVRELDEERDALIGASGDFSDVSEGSTCRTAISVLRRIESSASIGELGSMRQRLAASGKTVEELAAEWRRHLRQVSADFVAAQASGASVNAQPASTSR